MDEESTEAKRGDEVRAAIAASMNAPDALDAWRMDAGDMTDAESEGCGGGGGDGGGDDSGSGSDDAGGFGGDTGTDSGTGQDGQQDASLGGTPGGTGSAIL